MSSKPRLTVVTVSTRAGRVGSTIAKWFQDVAAADDRFAVEPVDLAELDLPLFAEKEHPRSGKYRLDVVKRWSATIGESDALVFVTPEYNHATPVTLLNAITYLYAEWQGKPVGFVGYGSGGASNSIAMTSDIARYLKMQVAPSEVSIDLRSQLVDGQLQPTEANDTEAAALLGELRALADAASTAA